MQRMRLRDKAVPHLAALLLLLGGCSGASVPPSWTPSTEGWPYPQAISWQRYRPGLQGEIDRAGEMVDCKTLYALFGEALDLKEDNPEVLTYISRWGRHDQCSRM